MGYFLTTQNHLLMNQLNTCFCGRLCSFLRSLFVFLALVCIHVSSQAQQVLFVNDNDNITYNTDTIRNDLSHTIYSGYHYWSIPDSAGATPSTLFMNTFDVVVWYCSTDGVGLKIWDASSTSANSELESYTAAGGKLWIIGQDMLYQKYTAPHTFTAGEFAKDHMGLTSYDVQSYVDDGSTGCPQMDRSPGASALFPSQLKWIFSTLWYADGCTPVSTTKEIYRMGPSTYSLTGKKSMFHNNTGGIDVMSTLFDPALIDTYVNRVAFMEKSITYLLGPVSGGVRTTSISNAVRMYPDPATTEFTLEIRVNEAEDVTIELFNIVGSRVKQQKARLTAGSIKVICPVAELSSGLYMVRVTAASGQCMYTGKLQKE